MDGGFVARNASQSGPHRGRRSAPGVAIRILPILLAMLARVPIALGGELVGFWEVVRQDYQGESVAEATLVYKKACFYGKGAYDLIPEIPVGHAEPFQFGTYRLGKGTGVRPIDFVDRLFTRDGKPALMEGICEIDGETLRTAFAEPGKSRPVGFSPEVRVTLWKRAERPTLRGRK